MTWLNCHRVANCLNSSQANCGPLSETTTSGTPTYPGKVNPKFGYHLSCTGRRQFFNFKSWRSSLPLRDSAGHIVGTSQLQPETMDVMECHDTLWQ